MGVFGALFGTPVGSRPVVVAQREAAFQRYFDVLCGRQDVTLTACFQASLAVVPPEPISHCRVHAWVLPATEGFGLTALLDIRPAEIVTDSAATVEAYHVLAKLVFIDKSTGQEELGLVADVRVPARYSEGVHARVEGLKPSADIEIQVVAANAVGRSSMVSVRVSSPSIKELREEADEGESVPRTPPPRHSVAGAEQAPHAETPPPEVTTAELIRRQRELEKWWEQRQVEAAQVEERQAREMEEFRQQREAFEQERVALQRQRSGDLTTLVLSGTNSPGCGSLLASPVLTPLGSPRKGSQLQALSEMELEGIEESAGPAVADWKALREQQKELAMRWEELQRARKEQQEQIAKAELEGLAREQAVQERENALHRQLGEASSAEGDATDLAALRAELQKQKEELQRRREAQQAESEQAALEAANATAAAHSQQEELASRARELREAEQHMSVEMEEAVERSREEQRQARESLLREREELKQLRDEQLAAATAAEAACAERARQLQEQQEVLGRQRRDAESDEAERDSRLESLRAEEEELQQREEQLEQERAAEEALHLRKAQDLLEAEKEFEQRTLFFAKTERALLQERQELARSRANLALVQAHVMSMLEKVQGGGTAKSIALSMDEEEEEGQAAEEDAARPEEHDGGKLARPESIGDGVWDLDWTAACANSSPAAGS